MRKLAVLGLLLASTDVTSEPITLEEGGVSRTKVYQTPANASILSTQILIACCTAIAVVAATVIWRQLGLHAWRCRGALVSHVTMVSNVREHNCSTR